MGGGGGTLQGSVCALMSPAGADERPRVPCIVRRRARIEAADAHACGAVDEFTAGQRDGCVPGPLRFFGRFPPAEEKQIAAREVLEAWPRLDIHAKPGLLESGLQKSG